MPLITSHKTLEIKLRRAYNKLQNEDRELVDTLLGKRKRVIENPKVYNTAMNIPRCVEVYSMESLRYVIRQAQSMAYTPKKRRYPNTWLKNAERYFVHLYHTISEDEPISFLDSFKSFYEPKTGAN